MSEEQIPAVPEKQHVNIVELTAYNVDFQIIQNPTKEWIYCIHYYPEDSDNGYLSDGEEIVNIGIAKKIADIKIAMIYSRETYSQWEYAAEAAIDIIELLGFSVENISHEFVIIKWTGERHQPLIGVYSGQDFKLKDISNG